jgi:O-antigen ligase
MANPEEAGGSRLIQWEYAIDISLERPFFGSGFDCFFHQPYYYRYVAHKDKNRAVHSSYFQVLAEQGYIGLAMYLSMLVMMLHVSRKYSLLGKGREDLRWATSLMGMTQFSVIGYAANGLTLNMAYLDLYYFLLAFVVLLITHIRQELEASPMERFGPTFSSDKKGKKARNISSNTFREKTRMPVNTD